MIDAAGIWAIGLGVLGALVGSFVATLVLRWPEERSVVHGRSACDGCGRTLRAIELIPLVSALASRGRCRRCGGRIDPLHWQVEAAALLIGASAGWIAPGPAGVMGAAFGWLLLALGTLDARAFWLPDRLVAPLALLGLAGGAVGLAPSLLDRLIGGAAGYALLALVAFSYRHWRGREGLGGGDPKLLGAIGLWLGWRLLPAVLLCAGLIGLGVVLFRQLTGRPMAATDALPLGTLMALAAYPAWLLMVGVGA
ncbi:A24 family peptidase [Sphingomonas sp. KR1UV-12]|uniref:Prepilin leader peptidase/N-methyltransferase n=1 Tax=Sphingomonas aurea TaxID=3063994 RepID=A0ABT9EGC7_9SPHN|nr:A24 family peptidase [Sphingomonas sp. KR1UV-12]MDP1025895.1 A24 family peptidase [Sphingomonas sp. KR1UV-12]